MTMLEVLSLEQAAAAPVSCEPTKAKCPMCGGKQRPWLALAGDWRRPSKRQPFQTAWCDSCDYGSLVPRPRLEELGEHYAVEDYYTHHAPQAVTATRTFADRLRVRLAWQFDRGREAELHPESLARYGVAPQALVCDIGCGNGGLLRRLAAAGYQVAGMDPDADACRTTRAQGFDVAQGTAEQLPEQLGRDSFDVVTMMHVLEHVLEPVTAVANIAELLKSGGRFVVETPNNACVGLREAGVTWRWLDVPRHLNFFTAESLKAVCRRAGLEIEAVEFTGYTRQFQFDWLGDEQEIHRRLQAMVDENSTPLPPRNSAARAWQLLIKTWRAADAQKYDSVRVIARKT
jgi:2-polyprenyl-3-methyl-5-hydroxy-6-metoxy-1,4-benzoquinol methylase